MSPKQTTTEHVVPPDSELAKAERRLAELMGSKSGTRLHEQSDSENGTDCTPLQLVPEMEQAGPPVDSEDGTKCTTGDLGSENETDSGRPEHVPETEHRGAMATEASLQYRRQCQYHDDYRLFKYYADIDPEEHSVTEILRTVIKAESGWRSTTKPAALSRDTGISKATLSRFMNSKGSLTSDKLDALADKMGLSLVRIISMKDHVDEIMAEWGDDFWSEEVSASFGDDDEDDERWLAISSDTVARAEWEAEFRPRLAAQERQRLQAISWVVLDDDMADEVLS